MYKWIILFLSFLFISISLQGYSKDVTQEGIDFIKSFESIRLIAYKCPAGVWTIGYGNTSHARPGLVITKTIALQYLAEDLKKFMNHVNANSKRNLTAGEFNALVSLTFNCGKIFTGNLAAAVNSNDIELACNKILSYCHAHVKINGKVKLVELKGLKRRRIGETVMYKEKKK